MPLNGATLDSIDHGLYFLWGLGELCAFWAIYALGATGQSKVMRAAPFVAMIGFAAMVVGEFLYIAGLELADILVGVAWIAILLGSLITAILAVVARTWSGWRKFAPLLCILAVPIALLLPGAWNDVLFGLSWMVLGYAVMTSPELKPVLA